MKKRKVVIHPGMIESPLKFTRVKAALNEHGYYVAFHRCFSKQNRINSDDDTLHIAHSGGFACPILPKARHVYLIAPPTSLSRGRAFFAKFWQDICDSFTKLEWGMFWYKNMLALWQLTVRYPYWRRMQARFTSGPPAFPRHTLVILHPHDPWTRDYDWSRHRTTTIKGQHDELLYRPGPIIGTILNDLRRG